MKFLEGERKLVFTDPVYNISITNVLVIRGENLGLFPFVSCALLKAHLAVSAIISMSHLFVSLLVFNAIFTRVLDLVLLKE
jgi:hypothetical protein